MLTFALLGGGVLAALGLGGLLLLALQSLRRLFGWLYRGVWAWDNCCAIPWPPPAKPWRSA